MKLSMRGKFLYPMIALIVIGMSVTTFVSYSNSRSAIQESVQEYAGHVLGSTEKTLLEWISYIKLLMFNWSQDDLFIAALLSIFSMWKVSMSLSFCKIAIFEPLDKNGSSRK